MHLSLQRKNKLGFACCVQTFHNICAGFAMRCRPIGGRSHAARSHCCGFSGVNACKRVFVCMCVFCFHSWAVHSWAGKFKSRVCGYLDYRQCQHKFSLRHELNRSTTCVWNWLFVGCRFLVIISIKNNWTSNNIEQYYNSPVMIELRPGSSLLSYKRSRNRFSNIHEHEHWPYKFFYTNIIHTVLFKLNSKHLKTIYVRIR